MAFGKRKHGDDTTDAKASPPDPTSLAKATSATMTATSMAHSTSRTSTTRQWPFKVATTWARC